MLISTYHYNQIGENCHCLPKFKLMYTLGPHNSTLRYIPNKAYTSQDIYKNGYSAVSHNRQHLETMQMFINSRNKHNRI